MALLFSEEKTHKLINIYLDDFAAKLKKTAAFSFGSDMHKGLRNTSETIGNEITIVDRDPKVIADATTERLNLLKETAVSRTWGMNPVIATSSEIRRFTGDQNAKYLYETFLAKSYVTSFMKDVYEVAIGASVAAISANTETMLDATAGVFNYKALNDGLAKFGDSSQLIQTLVMQGGVGLHSLIADASTAKAVDNVMGATVVSGDVSKYGRDSLVYDATALIDGANHYVLALVQNAIDINESEQRDMLFEKTGGTNIKYSYQVQGGYDIKIKGYSYTAGDADTAATAAEIKTAANWSLTASNKKKTAGVAIKAMQ